MEELEAEAKAKGSKYVMSILQQPGQLEKVDQYKRRVGLKKASVETSLKSALQNQLDGVRQGLELLQVAQDDVKEIKANMNWFKESIADIPDIVTQLQAVKEENMRHSQLVTAMDNLKHIFTVPDSVKKTKEWINESKLLYARQSLADLENSRDDLLFELHKLPQTPQSDIILLNYYFQEVEQLSDLMEKQIRLILSRTLNTVRKDPTIIVTALRIIEGEEKADAFSIQREQQTKFMPPGRPKNWKAKALSVLEQAVAQRIEGTQTDDREDHKMWLVRHLELTRILILEDLRVVKTLCVLCFPEHWDIVNSYVRMYHACLSAHLEDIIQQGLIGNEYVSVLSWCLNTYSGHELMANPDLNIDIAKYGPLLSSAVINDLQQKYLSHIKGNFDEWMRKTLQKEKDDWLSNLEPDEVGGYFQSSAPLIIFQMVDQNLQVAKTISPELTEKVLILSMEHMIHYGNLYKEAILELKTKHLQDRDQNPLYTHHMITVINNCLQFKDSAHEWRAEIHSKESLAMSERLIDLFTSVRDVAVKSLLSEAFTDLHPHFSTLVTTKWLTLKAPVDTICLTLEDYFRDYIRLKEDNFVRVISVAQTIVAKCYIYKIMEGKITFTNYDERTKATKKMKAEVNQIKACFHHLAPTVEIDPNFEIINPLVEIIGVEDPEMLPLDLHELIDRFPDITESQLVCLLMTRGDLSRSEVREKVSYTLGSRTTEPRNNLIKKGTGMFTILGMGNDMDWNAYWFNLLN